jgi:hypothetical protein
MSCESAKAEQRLPPGESMNSALGVHRLHSAFTIIFHYIFAQLAMGLAMLAGVGFCSGCVCRLRLRLVPGETDQH